MPFKPSGNANYRNIQPGVVREAIKSLTKTRRSRLSRRNRKNRRATRRRR